MKRRSKLFFHFYLMIFSLLLSSGNLGAQVSSLKSSAFKIVLSGNQQFASMSVDGRIVFQSDYGGNENIYLYSPVTDSTIQITSGSVDEQHPVWLPHKNTIVFDVGSGNNVRLYYFNLKTGKKKQVIQRDIACREASFTPSRHLVVFSGFDDRTQRWQIFTYDFVYDNLNRLTSENGNCNFPVFSPDGKTIAYLVRTGEGSKLKTISWYGKQMNVIASRVQGKVCWTPDNWRLLYISKTGKYFVIFSIRNDGTHKEVLFSSQHPFCCPTLSSDGRKLVLSMKKNNKFQLITLIKKE